MSPDGLTLVSKKLKGALKWGEVNSIQLIPKPAKPTQLKFSVDGADIILNDNFQHPIWHLKRKAEEMRVISEKQVQPDSVVGRSVESESTPQNPIESGNPYQAPR